MSVQSYIFDFSRVDNFYENLNINYSISDMNGAANKFDFILSSYSYDNIEDCINSNGVLKSEVITDNDYIKDAPLVWSNNSDGTNSISLGSDVTWDLGEDIVPIKAVFLVSHSTNYVLGFCINMNPVQATNTLTFDEDTVLWTVSDGGYHG